MCRWPDVHSCTCLLRNSSLWTAWPAWTSLLSDVTRSGSAFIRGGDEAKQHIHEQRGNCRYGPADLLRRQPQPPASTAATRLLPHVPPRVPVHRAIHYHVVVGMSPAQSCRLRLVHTPLSSALGVSRWYSVGYAVFPLPGANPPEIGRLSRSAPPVSIFAIGTPLDILNPALRSAGVSFFPIAEFGQYPGLQERLHQRTHPLVPDPHPHPVHQCRMRNLIEGLPALLRASMTSPRRSARGRRAGCPPRRPLSC